MAMLREGLRIAYGWVDPITKKVMPYKLLVPRCVVDTERPYPKPIPIPPLIGTYLSSEDKKFVLRYGKFFMTCVEEKVRFFVYSDPELDSLKALLDEDGITYTISPITLTPEQETAIKECEASKAHIREVIKRLGL